MSAAAETCHETCYYCQTMSAGLLKRVLLGVLSWLGRRGTIVT